MTNLPVIICISILELIFTITTLVLASNIWDETRDDPLEEYDKKIKSLNKTENTILNKTTIVSDELSKLRKILPMGGRNSGQYLHRRTNCIWML